MPDLAVFPGGEAQTLKTLSSFVKDSLLKLRISCEQLCSRRPSKLSKVLVVHDLAVYVGGEAQTVQTLSSFVKG